MFCTSNMRWRHLTAWSSTRSGASIRPHPNPLPQAGEGGCMAPSPPYSGERVGVRGCRGRGQASSANQLRHLSNEPQPKSVAPRFALTPTLSRKRERGHPVATFKLTHGARPPPSLSLPGGPHRNQCAAAASHPGWRRGRRQVVAKCSRIAAACGPCSPDLGLAEPSCFAGKLTRLAGKGRTRAENAALKKSLVETR